MGCTDARIEKGPIRAKRERNRKMSDDDTFDAVIVTTPIEKGQGEAGPVDRGFGATGHR